MDDTTPESFGEDAAAKLLAAAMPGTPAELAQRLLMEVAEPLGISGDPADGEDDAAKVAAALQMIQAAAPRDALEAMLAAQMAAVHTAAMRAQRRAAECTDYPKIEALYARQVARLMTLFMRQTEALEKRRARQEAAEARDAETQAQPIVAAEPKRANGTKPPRASRRTARKPARHNGAAPPPPAPRNGRRHRINGAGAPA